MKTKKIYLADHPSHNRVVKGRKDYECAWCGKKIYKGDHHTFFNGPSNSGSWWKQYRFHNECHEYLGRDERNAKFGFTSGKNIRPDENIKEFGKYLCEFWEAVSIPDSRRTSPFKRKVEIVAGSVFLARESCEEEFDVLEYIGTSKVMSVSEEDKELNKLINMGRAYPIKRRLRAVKTS